MKIFVDTNIFLDLLLKRDGYKDALMLFEAVESGYVEAVILDITILNIDYVAKKQVADISGFLEIVNEYFMIDGATNKEIKLALEIKNRDIEDNLQYIIAKKNGCEIVVTNDKNFYKGDITTITSREFGLKITL